MTAGSEPAESRPPADSWRGWVEWSVAVFARDESGRVRDCLLAIDRAAKGRSAHITLVINGSTDQTRAAAIDAASEIAVPMSIYDISLACKSNAINRFIYDLRPPADLYFFVDAAAFVASAALRELSDAMRSHPDLWAVSGLPANGRSARVMRRAAHQHHRLFGQMFALRPSFVDQIVAAGLRLPVGLYRGDGLLSGFIEYDLDPVTHPDRKPRLATVMTAEWRIRPITVWRWPDIRRQFERWVRQARGRLENASWNTIIWTGGFAAMPRFADDMIADWLAKNSYRPSSLADRLFSRIAIRRVRRWQRPSEEAMTPRLAFRTPDAADPGAGARCPGGASVVG